MNFTDEDVTNFGAGAIIALLVLFGILFGTGCATVQTPPAPPSMACEYVGCSLVTAEGNNLMSPLGMPLEECLKGVAATDLEVSVRGDQARFHVAAAYMGNCPAGIDNTQRL
jgi:hypothetical protein